MLSLTSTFINLTLVLSAITPALATWNNNGNWGTYYGGGICGEGFWNDASFKRCTPYTPPSGQNCGDNNWWWGGGDACGSKNRCVPITVPSSVAPPPDRRNHLCPFGWTWRSWNGIKVCSPRSPDTPSCGGKPTCADTHSWHRETSCCVPKTSRWARAFSPTAAGEKNDELCPNHLTSCPIAGASKDAYECLDIQAELESCGGCVSMGQGQDCTTAIPHAKSVGCEQGKCKVYSCLSGFSLSNGECV
ncbi:hypothetical protein [Phaffia rhodozyma]|uniref:Protein CPL1-like domain-containing protein n=1 Tax=Phaffia rhodozyma TaxID=264483 RepID=A0A0F7SPT3_PHARH|nr:hypothetical protein [Phaffia rhodozyma]